MTWSSNQPPATSTADALRRAAEARLGTEGGGSAKAIPSEAEARRLVHELQVHQIELELQNESLRATQLEVEAGLRQYTELFDFAPIGYFRLRIDGTISDANLAAAALVERERARLHGARFQAFIDEASRGEFAVFLTNVFSGTVSQQMELRLDTKGRSLREVVLSGALSPVKRECLITVLDVSEQRRLAREVRATEDRYRRIVEGTSEGVITLDATGSLTFVNARFAQMLGYAPGEMLRRGGFAGVERTAQGLGTLRVEQRRKLQHKNGQDIWVRVISSPLVDGGGKPEGTLALVSDITEIVRFEQVAAALENTQAQLRQSQKLEAIGSLASGMAHDFNNLLSVILGYASLALEDCGPERALHAELDQIVLAARRGAELTQQLLIFSRRQVLKPTNVDLNQCVHGLKEMLARLLGAEMRLTVVDAAAHGQLFADRGQVEQVIMNLALNARDSMPEGGEIRIETADVEVDAKEAELHPDAKPGHYVLLRVQDTGTGIEDAVLPRVFEPFFTTKEQGKGTGLGLSTVYGVVKQSGGYIDVTSAVGQGTTFSVYFPRAVSLLPNATPRPGSPVVARGTESILLVDDQAAVRSVTAAVLRRAGYHVLDVPSAADALVAFEQHRGSIQLLLTDVVMPHMNGKQLAERMLLYRPGLKVLYVSGHPRDVFFGDAFAKDGARAYLEKPFLPETLLREVRSLLDATPTAQA